MTPETKKTMISTATYLLPPPPPPPQQHRQQQSIAIRVDGIDRSSLAGEEGEPYSFTANVPDAKKRRLTSMYADIMADAQRRLQWQEAEDRVRETIAKDVLEHWTFLLMVILGTAVCSTCRKECVLTWPQNRFGEVSLFVRDYVERCFASRPWAPPLSGRAYFPTDIEVKQFLTTLLVNFFRRDETSGNGVHCGNAACDSKGVLVSDFALVKERKQREGEKQQQGSMKEDQQKQQQEQQQQKQQERKETSGGEEVDRLDRSIMFSSSSFLTFPDAPPVSTTSLEQTSATAVQSCVTALSSLRGSTMTQEEAQALAFGDPRCMWIEIKQHDINDVGGFSLLFIRWTGNEQFVMSLLKSIDNVPTAAAEKGNATARRRAVAYRLHYQFDLQNDRLITYAQVLERTRHCTKVAGYKEHQVHHFAHVITTPFRKDMLVKTADGRYPTVLEILQMTHNQWLTALDEPMKRRYEAEFERQVQAQKERHEQQRNEWLQKVKTSSTLTISAAFSQHTSNAQKVALVTKYYAAIAKLVSWLGSNTLDSVRCAEPIDSRGVAMPQLFHSLPFLFFLHSHCDLVTSGLVEQSRRHLCAPLAPMFDDYWPEEVQTLLSITSPIHIEEHCANPRNLVGVIRSAKPFTLLLPIEVICAIEGFIQIYEQEFPILRQMLAGTRLRLITNKTPTAAAPSSSFESSTSQPTKGMN